MDALPQVPARRPARAARAALLAGAGVLLAVYAWRLTLGADLSDESYYAVAPVSWLRSAPADTGNLSAHQLSGTLTYPLVRLHAWLRPDLTGLMLSLRAGYALLALAAAGVTYACLRRVLPAPAAAACASVLVTFIPFGLPAPSYNTLGMLGIIGGALALTRALLDRKPAPAPPPAAAPWLALAAGLLALGTVAYPTLVVLPPLAGLLLTAAFPRQWRLVTLALLLWAAAAALLLTAAVAALGGPDRLRAMLRFSFLLNANPGGTSKLAAAWALLTASKAYLAACALVLALGLLARLTRRPAALLAALAGLAAWWVLQPRRPVFFARGHDLVFLLALAGLPAVVGRLADPRRRALAALYLLGLAGGLLTAWTASNSLVNFCLLGVLAALAGLAAWVERANDSAPRRPAAPRAAAALAALLSLTLAATSLAFVYGEFVPPAALTARVREGPFAGLRSTPDKLVLLRQVRRDVDPHLDDCRTVEVLGHLPGLYLLTPLRLRTPMPYMIQDYAAGPVVDHLARFYLPPGRPADLVLLADNPELVLNRVQAALVRDHYDPVARHDPVTVYRRRATAVTAAPGPR